MTSADPPPPRLDYRPPAADRRDEPSRPFWVQMAVGFGAFILTLLVFLLGAAASVNLFATPQSRMGGVLLWLLLIAVALLVVTVHAWTRWRWRGFAAGVLTGFGVLALLVGLCFAAVIYG